MLTKKRFLITVLVFALLLSGLAATLFLIRTRQENRTKAAGETHTLSLATTTPTVNPGDSFDVNVNIAAVSTVYKVTAVTTQITYPTALLTLNSVTPGALFMSHYAAGTTQMLNIINTATAGLTKITLGVPCTTASPWVCYADLSAGTVATLHFTAKASGQAAIGFVSTQTAGAAIDANKNPVNNNTNIINLAQLAPLTVTVNSQTPPPPPPSGDKANLTFSLKFQGISSQKANKNVRVILKQNGIAVRTFDSIPLTADASGLYTGTITDVTPGTYDILIKGAVYLQKKFPAVTLNAGNNTANWSTTILKAGDFLNHNRITINDISTMLSQYTTLHVPVTAANQIYDIDGNGNLDINDISAVLGNYTSMTVLGDE